MSTPLDTIKSQVRELRAYTLKAERTRVKLNQNENPWDAPLEIKQETLRRISRGLVALSDFTPHEFHERLADSAAGSPKNHRR